MEMVLRLIRRLLVAALAVCAGTAAAEEEISYHGCTDATGRPVVSRADATMQAVVTSAVDGGQPVIRYNPRALARLQPSARLFLFAHECARHNLGLPVGASRTPESARRADCWGLASLRRSGLLAESEVAALEADLQFADEEWALVPGPRRGFDLASCRQGGNILSLSGTAKPARSSWNACVHACGERLRSCQGGARPAPAACVDTNERCVAGCESLLAK